MFRLAVLTLALTLALPVAAMACRTPGDLAEIQADLIRAINAQRQNAGLAALARSDALMTAAERHACDNAGHNHMSHVGSDGSKLGTRIDRVGYVYGKANENVGYGYARVADMVQGWMQSQGHRRNILERGTREIGVGIATGRDGRPYWVMVSAVAR